MARILGISCLYHDGAASLLVDGEIVAAAQEERFTRRKHDPRFPRHAIRYCLEQTSIVSQDLDYVVFYDKPFITFERLLASYIYASPRGLRSWLQSMPLWLGNKLRIARIIEKELEYDGEILFTEHHQAHAASAFFVSPFNEAAILTVDGVGEWATASIGVGKGNSVEILKEMHFPNSLGLLYSAFTYFTGFKVNSGEYKLMGLAPYGRPVYKDLILEKLVDVKDDGSLKLNLSYFDFLGGLRMTNRKLDSLLGGPPRRPESEITIREMDLAASIQAVTEEVLLKMARHAHEVTGMKHLCMAGGVALNCVANGRILREGPFESLWIQPAAGDAGGSLGAALAVHYGYLGNERSDPGGRDSQKGSYLGPSFESSEIEEFLRRNGYPYSTLNHGERARKVAELIAAGRIVGFFAGRMEFGPRALGARSILGDPRTPETQRTMNLKIKYRESFRPFAPSLLEEDCGTLFEDSVASPYMLLVTHVRPERRKSTNSEVPRHDILGRLMAPRSDIPAVTHMDYSARIQTVSRESNPYYYDVIKEFKAMTGYGIIVNTSFNVRGEPIVCTPEDAYTCFMRTKMDALVLEDMLLLKEEQPEWKEETRWQDELVID